MRRTKIPHPRKAGVSKIATNTSVDNRLTHASMLLSYLFEEGVDFQRRIIKLTGEVNEVMFDKLDAALTEMEADSRAAITIKIDSEGGEVYQAMAIVGRIRESKCQIITKGYGMVMSAATLILAAGDKRKISKYAWFMAHEMSYEMGDTRHSHAKAFVQQAEREAKVWAQWMAEFTKKPESYWVKVGIEADAYFTAEQLLKMGVVDELF